MAFTPSAYVVLRKSRERGYPNANQLSSLFYNTNLVGEMDEGKIVLHYARSLRDILVDYKSKLSACIESLGDCNEHKDEHLSKIAKFGSFQDFLNHTSRSFMEIDFGLKKSSAYVPETPANELKDQCKSLVNEILKLANGNGNQYPLFLFILDEASLLTEDVKPGRVNLFRLFRRALNLYFLGTNFFVLTLGTNSDVLDWNPGFTSNSYRQDIPGKLFPPFILSRN
jgi:hypothetical protein